MTTHATQTGAAFLVLLAVASAACATGSHASGRPSEPVRASLGPIIEVTEPDATVAMSLGPLVVSAGPSMLFVPAGHVRCAEDMALVGDRVCVDKWEATIVRVTGGKETQLSPFDKLDEKPVGYRAVSRKGVVPQGYISGHQAERACRASGKRLCTTAEWELGCRGPQRTQFPYGNERQRAVCNDDIRDNHPVLEAARLTGVSGKKVWLDGMNLSVINQLPDTLAKTGERSACVTEEGVFDMVGNLHEWVADADGTFRGGYYMDTTKNGDGCSYRTTAHDFEYHDYSTGFRCCSDPEPIE